jgi:hypothetical protein
MALLEQQQPLMSKHVGRLGALARGARRKDELVAEERLHLDLETLDGKHNENQVEIAADQRSNKSLGDRLAEVQSEIRGAPLQLGQCRRQEIGRDRRNGPKLERSRQHTLAMLGGIEHIAH